MLDTRELATAWAIALACCPADGGKPEFRVVVAVPPVELAGRSADELVAAVDLDFVAVAGAPCDPASLRVLRVDEGGRPLTAAASVPFRYYDADVPWDYPDRIGYAHNTDGRATPVRRMPGGGRFFGVQGSGRRGRVAWVHVQRGDRPARYAICFRGLAASRAPLPAPAGFIGDGSHRCEETSRQFAPVFQGRVEVADLDGDGLFDLLLGNATGTVLYYRNAGRPGAPHFGAPRLLRTADGQPLDVGWSSAPAAADWDHDGDVDLIVGAEKESLVFFRNTGNAHQAQFVREGLLQAGGKPIRIPRAPCEEDPDGRIYPYDYAPVPQVVDYDGDGDLDLLAGGYITGRIFFYRNIADDPVAEPQLRYAGPLQADGRDLDVTWCAAPCAADFDGDGDLDLISGAMQMTPGGGDLADPERFLWYFENVGTRAEPRLTHRCFPARGRFAFGALGTPRPIDFNEDGTVDLIVSVNGCVLMVPNVGEPTQPLFDATVQPLAQRWGNATLPFRNLADVNGDGWTDMLDLESVWIHGAGPLSRPFGAPIPLTADRRPIEHQAPSGDVWNWPAAADLDGDGIFDLLVGDHEGYVWFHRNAGSNERPRIDPAGVKLRLTNGETLRVGQPPDTAAPFDVLQGARTVVTAADFDRDGRLDLVVGDTYGFVRLFAGATAPGIFEPPRVLARLHPVRLTLARIDWDDDGWDDLLLAYASGEVYVLVNKARRGDAAFADPQPVEIPPCFGDPWVFVADWNHDGDDDLLIQQYGYLRFVERSFLKHGYVRAHVVGCEQTGSGDAPRPITITTPDRYADAAYPSLARLADGRLLCVFSARGDRTHSRPVVVARFSSDAGRSWSEPRVLIDSDPELSYDPSILVAGETVLVTATVVPPTHGQFVSTSQIVAVRSEDSGRTWSRPWTIRTPHRYTSGKINNGLQLPDGTWLLPFSWDAVLETQPSVRREGQMVSRAAVLLSRDAGQTWNERTLPAIARTRPDDRPAAINGLDEPALALCQDGSLFALLRTGLDRLYESRSRDGGRTWSQPKPSALTSHNAPACLCPVRLADGRRGLLVVWNNSGAHRWPLCAAVSFDDGHTWGTPRELVRRPGLPSAYPACAQSDDGAIVIVWQQAQPGGGRTIEGVRCTLDWLIGQDGTKGQTP